MAPPQKFGAPPGGGHLKFIIFQNNSFFARRLPAMLAALVFVGLQAGISQRAVQKGAAAASERRFMLLLGEQWKSLKPLIET